MKKYLLNQVYRIAYSSPTTVNNSYESVEKVIRENIEGDLVEMGVALGAQIIAFNFALIDHNQHRKIHAFDSFRGIPLAGPKDTQQPGLEEITHDVNLPLEQRLISSGVTSHSLIQVKSNFRSLGLDMENVNFYEGWFQDTLPEHSEKIEKISVLRLDGDLYESTMISMEYLYPKVSVGGIVIVDDYGLDGCKLALEDYFSGSEYPEMILVDQSVHYFVKKK